MIRRYGLNNDTGAVWNLFKDKGEQKKGRSQSLTRGTTRTRTSSASGPAPRLRGGYDSNATSPVAFQESAVVQGGAGLTSSGVTKRGERGFAGQRSQSSAAFRPATETVVATREVPVEESPAPPSDTPTYGDICYLHAVGGNDSLLLLSLKYDTTEGIIVDVNQLEKSTAEDLACMPPSSLLVIPMSQDADVQAACMELRTKPDFLELYGSRLPSSFLHRRMSRVPPPPQAQAQTQGRVDEFDQFNEACDFVADDWSEQTPIRESAAGGPVSGSSSSGASQRSNRKSNAGINSTLKGVFNAIQSAGAAATKSAQNRAPMSSTRKKGD